MATLGDPGELLIIVRLMIFQIMQNAIQFNLAQSHS